MTQALQAGFDLADGLCGHDSSNLEYEPGDIPKIVASWPVVRIFV